MSQAAIRGAQTPEVVVYRPVDRLKGLSVKEFRRQYQNRKPVVITDALQDWNAWNTWTFDAFTSRFGNSLVSVYPYDQGRYRADRVERLPLAEYIQNILRHDFNSYPYYLIYNSSLLDEHEQLKSDFSEPKYCYDWFKFVPKALRFPSPRLYLGPKGAISSLHQDRWGSHFWMAQFEGRKRWILFPPHQEQFLYKSQGTEHDQGLIHYHLQPDKPDLKKFPMFKHASGLECTIGPGDLLIVPGNWLHWVLSLDATLSLTHNYMGPGNFLSCMKGQSEWSFQYVLEKFRH